MRNAQELIAVFVCFLSLTEGLRCWHCENEGSPWECLKNGYLETCLPNQDRCQNEIRSISNGMYYKITKRCKQDVGCSNNKVQTKLSEKKYQCEKTDNFENVCWCCCETDNCNGPTVKCYEDRPQCKRLGRPLNGMISCYKSETALGTQCIFRCNAGFELTGDDRTLCVRRGLGSIWTRSAPRCVARSCRSTPASLKHGSVSCTDGSRLNSVCTFTCDPGYFIQGYYLSACTHFGKWDEPQPKCVKLNCRNPRGTDRNLKVECDDRYYIGSTCRFTCPEGYDLKGRKSITCKLRTRKDGIWGGRFPTCFYIENLCPIPRGYGARFKSCTSGYKIGSVCTYRCASNEYMTSSSDVTISEGVVKSECLEDRSWSHDVPKCNNIVCSSLQRRFSNGNRQCTNGVRIRSECQYTCIPGYHLKGRTMIECLKTSGNEGKWSGDEPTCRESICPELIMNDYITVDCSNGNVEGSSCTFKCKVSTYELLGTSQATCFKSFANSLVWDLADVPICRRVTCPIFESINNGAVSCSKRAVDGRIERDTTCTVSCDRTFTPKDGIDTVTCVAEDTYEPGKICCSKCRRNPSLDVAFLLDTSNAEEELWDIYKTFVPEVALYLTDNLAFNLNVTVIPFASDVDVENIKRPDSVITLGNYQQLESLVSGIPVILSEASNSGKTLQYVNDVVFSELSLNRVPVIYLVTNKAPSDQALANQVARSLRDRNIHIRIVPLVDFFNADAGSAKRAFTALTGNADNAIVEDDSVEDFYSTATNGIDKVSILYCNHPRQSLEPCT